MNSPAKILLGLYLAAAALMFPVPAAAAPSFTGSTGMINIPTADVLSPGHVAAGYYHWQDHDSGVLTVGAGKDFEISAAAPWQDASPMAWTVNAKINISRETLLTPAVAVGIEDIDGRNRRSVYGVISKVLPYGYRIHVGTGTGRFDGMFGAVEKVLNPTSVRQSHSAFPVTSLIIEMDGNKMNYGARMSLAHGLRLDAGWQGQTEKMFLGLTYTN